MMLANMNPLAVQQAAAAAAATISLQQSMKNLAMHDPSILNPLFHSHLGEDDGHKAKGKAKGKGKDEKKKKREGRRGQGPASLQPAEDLNAAVNQPLPENCSKELQLLRQRGDKSMLTLRDLEQHAVEFAMDQYGSRFLQQALEGATEDEKNMIFMRILPETNRLTTDVFGNYVIQKFLEHGNSEIRRVFAEQLVGDVLRLSLHQYGCRVVQKVLEEVSTDQQVLLVAEIKGHVIKCIEDQNGNHVVQKCIEEVSTDQQVLLV